MSGSRVITTGQIRCYDAHGREISCQSTGQDADMQCGISHPAPRFLADSETVQDSLTDLIWTRNANLNSFPVTWQESFDLITTMNLSNTFGCSDWRLPNRRELHSLMHYQAKKPSLPEDHPFSNCFLGWYWTSTSAAINPAYAWNIHLEGARMFYSNKKDYRLFWPVRGKGNDVIAATGQQDCFNQNGMKESCRDSGQDGALQMGRKWPEPRFQEMGEVVCDRLTNLCWLKKANVTQDPVDWQSALNTVARMRAEKTHTIDTWRLPNINELESLTDCSQASPALPMDSIFTDIQETYWSSTTSYYETDWAWVYYAGKGALGVGYKKNQDSFVWPVSGTSHPIQ